MTNLYDIYKTNNDLETEKGITLEFEECGCSFQILRAGSKNKRYTKAAEKHSKKYKRQIQLGTLSKEKDREVMIKIYADSIIIGWKGVKDEDGKDMPFSRENCIKLFSDLPELFEMIHEQAGMFSNFQEEAEQTKKK